MHTYIAKVLEKIDIPHHDGRSRQNSTKVGVFRVEGERQEQIGEYIRDYPAFFNTFFYFRKGDSEYALYSRAYTATRIMELPACNDIGGEEPNSVGFCPTDFYVPSYIEYERVNWDDSIKRYRINKPPPEQLLRTMVKYYPLDEKTGERKKVEKPAYPVTPLLYYPFGFVAGCVWGDDSFWKIQYLDLSQAEKGILKRDERFGYIALPDKLSLKDAIDMSDYLVDFGDEDPSINISIAIKKSFNLQTGKMVDE